MGSQKADVSLEDLDYGYIQKQLFFRSKEPFPMFERNEVIAKYCPKRGEKTLRRCLLYSSWNRRNEKVTS